MIATGAIAQSAEFGRGSSVDAINAIGKTRRPLSGSLTLSRSNSSRGDAYEGTLGGELLDDRLWFFAAASVFPRVDFSTADFRTVNAIDAKATAQPVDWSSVTASFHQSSQASVGSIGGAIPSSFLSLRSTTILSDRAFFDFSVSQTKTTRPRTGLAPFDVQ